MEVNDERECNKAMLSYHSNILTQNPDKLQESKKGIETNDNDELNNNEKLLCDEEEDDVPVQYSSNRKSVFAQCMVAGAMLMLNVGVGMPIGYSAILLPQLSEVNGTFHIDESMGSWIASIHSLASPLGSLLTGPMLDAIGRRSCLQLATIPLCIAWLLIGFASNISWILFGRFSAGFGVGMCSVAVQVFLGEVIDARVRASVTTASTTAYCAGMLLVYILGSALKWQTVAFCGTILPIISLILLTTVSESPAWLVRKGKINVAKKALMWLRGDDAKQVTTEMSILEARAKEDLSRMSLSMTFRERALETRAKVLHPGVLKPLLIINVFFLLQVCSGTFLVVSYGVDLMHHIAKGSINKYMAAVMTALIRVFFCFLSCFLMLRIGRRAIALISAIGSAVASIILGVFLLLNIQDTGFEVYVIGICLIVYVSFNTIGLLALPGMMVGELLPHRARGVGGGCTMFLYNFSLFATTKIFPMLKNMVGIGGIFLIFGASAVLETIFTWLIMPETKNRTLQEIEDYFKEGNILWIRRKNRKQRLSVSES
ncbi:facilitated trehalose transporter Tret1-2 homolog [Chelonus insularis]|uniref:facilitated trehalose transporter Tret1-2 homolog n=1 Tax=Chelonus insularis TaxID=460826 RepID=UPI00158BC879|nr:facilitated trehalose transporter Tret1-2 homolog [Chelonus insularis]